MAKIKKILISQQTPSNLAPYSSLAEKYSVDIEFKPFFLIEPLTSLEFRSQRVNILDFTAIVFSSRHAIDAFFALSEELRIKIPETMKYFCTTEAVAMYLQKHIIYRKRKIFFGNGTPASIIEQIGTKHTGERFLITTSDQSRSENITKCFDEKGLEYSTAVLIKSVSQDLKSIELSNFDLIMLYASADVKSLYENYPDFKQGDIKFASYGKSIVSSMKEAGLEIEFQAPTPEAPSAAKAIELYLERNK